MIVSRIRLWLSALICLAFLAAPISAAITPIGDVTPSTVGQLPTTSVTVGNTDVGGLFIDAGSTLTTQTGTLGMSGTAIGTATISGPNSQWINTSRLDIGRNGTGILNIEAGGQVNNNFSYMGRYVGSIGSATVTGAGSQWNNTTSLYVGYDGAARLTVADGGEVTSKALFASLSDLYGNGTITVEQGGVMDAELRFDASHGLHQNLAFGSGGQLGVSWTSNGILGVGYKQYGDLTITDAVEVTSGVAYLGYRSGATGVATISGNGSQCIINNDLYVAYLGEGSLTLESGGTLSTERTTLGFGPNSIGTITITGQGSHWSNSHEIFIGSTLPMQPGGNAGLGTLIIESGGLVDTSGGSISANSAARITGHGSQWNSDDAINVAGSMLVESGAKSVT